MHIWKEHVEIDQITNFHEKINWQSLLYRIPLTDMFKNLKMSFMTSQYQIYSVKSEKTICKRTVDKLMIQYLTIVDDLTNILIM